MILWMLAALVGYFIKGVAGIGNTLVITSAMAYTRTNAEITPVELLLCLVPNMTLAWANRRSIDWKLALPPLFMVLAGDVLGVLLLTRIEAAAMKLVFGVVLIVLGIEALWRERQQRAGNRNNPILMGLLGVAAGVLCGMFSVGALLAAYFSRVTKDNSGYKGSMCMIFAVENVFRVIAYGLSGLLTAATFRSTVLLLPFMGAGLFLGMKCSGRISARKMRVIVNMLLLVSGLSLILSNL